MLIYPAIDILDGKCVQLSQGNFNQGKTYFENPLDAAKLFEDSGASAIHIVDLEGSRHGKTTTYNLVKAIASSTDLSIQMGGGIRSIEDVEALLGIGVERVVIGSLITQDPKAFYDICQRYGKHVVCAVDFKDKLVMTKGWEHNTKIHYMTLLEELDTLGCSRFLVTNIARDGMLNGPDLKTYQTITQAFKTPVIASGGISSLDDVKALNLIGIKEAIVGTALYEGAFTLKEGHLSCLQNE